MVDTFNRDKQREKRKTAPETKLKTASTHPTKYDLMAVGLAKATFHPDTIHEQALNLAARLGKATDYLKDTNLAPAAPTLNRIKSRLSF